MVRFLHTGDWQLGLTRHFLNDDAQARYTQARFDVIQTLGRLAGDLGCAFIVVAGDVFESNQVQAETVRRALDALRTVPVPVYLLPGNHDPHNGISVYRSAVFTGEKPEHVHVLTGAKPVAVAPGVELVGAPWLSKRPQKDLVGEALAQLAPEADGLRVLVGHGAADALFPGSADPVRVRVSQVEAAMAEGRLHYLALGDRHSSTVVGAEGRIAYAGSPEPTAFDEERPGFVRVVELAPGSCRVTEHAVGCWTFLREEAELSRAEDVAALRERLRALPEKARTIVRLELHGTLPLSAKAELDLVLQEHADLFPALFVAEDSALMVRPDAGDMGDLGLSGHLHATYLRLQELAAEGDEAGDAQDALSLLYRLSRSAS